MPIIKILDQELINKIAAGEVVERPASVVKELVENALDAGATDIVVDIEDGGLTLIRITDNGGGMEPEDLRLSIRRYATSKISQAQDLYRLQTYGFRGEALAAISAVSDFRLASRPGEQASGMELLMNRGDLHIQPAGMKPGTVVEVRGLFNNVPARKKFLKGANTEFRHIADVVTQQSIMNPQVSWRLTHNGKTILNYVGVHDWQQRVAMVLGKDVAKDLIDLKHQRASLILTGFLTHPAHARQTRGEQYVFVNRRPVQDYLLAKAVKQGYSHHIEPNRYPAFVLHVSIAPDLVDVNVHPRKLEVKFADPSSIFREIAYAVHEALEQVSHTTVEVRPSLGQHGQAPFVMPQSGISSPSLIPTQAGIQNSDPATYQTRQTFVFQQPIADGTAREPSTSMDAPSSSTIGHWKLLGQLHRSFLLVESEEGLLVIDQHAGAEKILYEKLLEHVGQPKVQKLLIPTLIELSPSQFALAIEQLPVLAELGVEAEEFGERTLRLTGIPQDLDVRDLKNFLFGVLQDMQDEGFTKLPNLEQRQQRLAKYAACRGAIKFNDPLTREEQLQLLADMQKYHVIACCHGRPVMKKLTVEQLRREFHRP